MADGKIKISELEEALQLSDNAEFPYSQDNGGVRTTFKAPANQIARKVAEGSTFTNLETTAKTLVGAINELSHLGNPILLGTTAPTSSQGADGNIYVQYTEGTGGVPDTVDSIYAKIDGAWCEIETGGGGGTADYEDLSNKPQVNSVELVGNKSLDDLGIMPASLSKTVSGSLVHITDGADNIPVKSLVSQIVAVESGNGQPKSPDNPYTISGFASGIITVTDNDQITNTYTFTFGQTVYGGHFDNKGNLVVDCGFIEYDGSSDENWQEYSAQNGFYIVNNEMKVGDYQDGLCNWLNIIGSVALFGVALGINNTQIRCCHITDNISVITDLASWKTYLSSNPLKVLYPLANPITLSITSQDIPTLLGENNIFSNCGDVEVDYYISNSDDIVDLIKSVGTGGFQPVIYSEDEREIGVWKDGKPLYEKTLNLSVTNTGDIFDISNLHIDTMIQVAGFIHQTGGNNPSVPYSSSPNDYALPYYSFSDDSIHVIYAGSYNQTIWVITVRYTKTTDTAGSGQWTPQGVPAHHYSTDEQVVGTWIDGSTVYEKTLLTPSAVTIASTGAWIGSGVSKPSGSNVVRADIVNDYITGVIGIYVSSTNELYLSNIPKTADITIPANTPITIRYTKTA